MEEKIVRFETTCIVSVHWNDLRYLYVNNGLEQMET
jgi:hypothetical protein